MVDYAKKFKELRDHFDLTQSDLASKVGCSRSIVSQIEISKQKPTLEIIQKIVRIFNIDYAFLLDKNVHLISPKHKNENVHLNVHPNVHLNDQNSPGSISAMAREEDVFYGGRRVTGGQDHNIVLNIQDDECLIIYKVSGLIVSEHRALDGTGSLRDRIDSLETRILEIKRLLNSK